MSTHRFGSRVALESAVEELPLVSMEEQEILISEAHQYLNESEEQLNDAERLEETATALEDVVMAADQIEEATPSDLIMIEAASRLAVAGSDIDPEEITPSLEQFHGTRVSMEGVRRMISAIWEAIRTAVKRVYEKIEGFFYKILGTIPRLKKSIEAVRARAHATVGKTVKENKTTVGAEINSLFTDIKVVKDGTSMLKGFNNLELQTAAYMRDYPKPINKMGERIKKALDNFDADKVEDSLGEAVKGFAESLENDFDKVSKNVELSEVTGDSRFAPGEYAKLAPLPGGKSIFCRAPLDGDEESVLGMAEKIRKVSYSLQGTTSTSDDPAKEDTINTLNIADIQELMDLADKICDHVEQYTRGGDWKKVKKTRDSISKAANKLTNDMERNRELTSHQMNYYRSMVSFVRFYARLSTQPAAQLTSHALRCCRAAVSVSNRSLSNYA